MVAKISESDEKRFISRIQVIENGCWKFNSVSMAYYYRGFWFDGKKRYAHHFSWYRKTGEWPTLEVCHSCDNKACVNPEHLFHATHFENILDAREKGLLGRNRITSSEMRKQIKELSSRMTQRAIAEKFGVSQPVISRTINDWFEDSTKKDLPNNA